MLDLSDVDMADAAACADQSDAAPGKEQQLQETPPPDSLPPMAKLALKHCKLYACIGSSFRIACDLCGFGEDTGVVTNAHKLIYGHYLAEKGNDIATCLSLGKLKGGSDSMIGCSDCVHNST